MPNFVFTASAARTSRAKENKDTALRYVRALASSGRYMRAPANREDVVSYKADQNTKFVTATLDLFPRNQKYPDNHQKHRGDFTRRELFDAFEK